MARLDTRENETRYSIEAHRDAWQQRCFGLLTVESCIQRRARTSTLFWS